MVYSTFRQATKGCRNGAARAASPSPFWRLQEAPRHGFAFSRDRNMRGTSATAWWNSHDKMMEKYGKMG